MSSTGSSSSRPTTHLRTSLLSTLKASSTRPCLTMTTPTRRTPASLSKWTRALPATAARPAAAPATRRPSPAATRASTRSTARAAASPATPPPTRAPRASPAAAPTAASTPTAPTTPAVPCAMRQLLPLPPWDQQTLPTSTNTLTTRCTHHPNLNPNLSRSRSHSLTKHRPARSSRPRTFLSTSGTRPSPPSTASSPLRTRSWCGTPPMSWPCA